jgi:hypothetical protein
MSEPVVVDAQVKEPTRKTTLRSEGTGLLKKDLTEPTLLEISGNPTNRELLSVMTAVAVAHTGLSVRLLPIEATRRCQTRSAPAR